MSASTDTESRNDRNRERVYWLSRQWVYQSLEVPRPISLRTSGATDGVDRSGRQLTPATSGFGTVTISQREISKMIQNGRIIQSGQDDTFRFGYLHHSSPIRPIAARLLELMWVSKGKPIPITTVCRGLWGRPAAPTYNTFHTTIFRVNAALHGAQFPLRLRARANQILFSSAEEPK